MEKQQMQQKEQTSLQISGMTCAACATRIEKGLNKLPGVSMASVNLALETAHVEFNKEVVSIDQMIHKVSQLGYGESLPVDKKAGDTVIGATVNKNGSLSIRATKVGSETALAQIIKVVENAQGSKAPIQRVADRISGIFVPIVVGIGIVTFLIWYFLVEPGEFASALEKAIAVLVIACPCALGLATPTSIMAGSGRAAEAGILFKGGEHLESLQNVQCASFTTR
jgi:Cation transport ATPase